MRRKRVPGLTAAVTTALALTLPILPAGPAAAASPAAAPGSSLTLTIVPDRLSGPRSTVTLECDPPGGTHPDPKAACAVLEAAGGYFERIEPGSGGCTGLWDPVTVRADGNWGARKVLFEERYSNRGCAAAATNGVFRF
ncbi:SSI family serine proteinase inhibitor [Streptomyces albus]|uniref:SSI family serine proteinase inhibitor n=1 Tax=Streptomyces albus TaxID=1888 RepID=UPI0006918519|nr:SSI family serine proteinase inhibitor [Streptomyces albus]